MHTNAKPPRKPLGRLTVCAVALLGALLTATAALSSASSSQVDKSKYTRLPVSNAQQSASKPSFPRIDNAVVFSNPTSIEIPLVGNAAPYPSNITVSGLLPCITRLRVTLHNFSHTFTSDVDVVLVGPTGLGIVVMAGAGNGNGTVNSTLLFDDSGPLLTAAPIVSGTYHTTDLGAGGYAAPGPAVRPVTPALASYNGTNPNGTWSLYVVDRVGADFGRYAGGWSLEFATTDPVISPNTPISCLTPGNPCVEVPVTIQLPCPPAGAEPRVHSYSVNLTFDPLVLAPCVPGAFIVEGSYLSSVGSGTVFLANQISPGNYRIDAFVTAGGVGPNCGQVTSAGTLFTARFRTLSVADGTSPVAVSINNVSDCNGIDLGGVVGPPINVTFRSTTPSISNLRSEYVQTLNPGNNGLNRINLTWAFTGITGNQVNIYRLDFGPGTYPTYTGSAPIVPAACPPGGSWVLVSANNVTGAFVDTPPTRGFQYYIACANELCPGGPVMSNLSTDLVRGTPGTLNYHLGDVTDGVTPGTGDDLVNVQDLTLLGSHYLAADPAPAYTGFRYLDIGSPAVTGPNIRLKRPQPDLKIDFFDMSIATLNFGTVSAPNRAPATIQRAVVGSNAVWVLAPKSVQSGETFTATLKINGVGDIQAMSTHLGWDGAVVEPLSIAAGDIMTTQNGMVLSGGPGVVDAFMLGERSSGNGMYGEGTIATVTFHAIASGDPNVELASIDARDSQLNQLLLQTTAVGDAGSKGAMFAVSPNPFQQNTSLAFGVAQRGAVELAVYSVDGRRVKTLVRGTLDAGVHSARWNGTDENGTAVKAGVFFARLTIAGATRSKTITFVR